MPEIFSRFLEAFIPLFVALDPLGMAPLFLGLTRHLAPRERRRAAYQAVLTAALVAVGFLFLGRAIFRVLGITVADFEVAGGLVLLVLAGRDLVAPRQEITGSGDEVGVVPLGLPLIAGPATLTVLLWVTEVVGWPLTMVALLLNLGLVMLALWFAGRLAGRFGGRGLLALTKIVSLLLAAIAVHMIRLGWAGP
ncbi:MAG: MarC family protein [Deltaproteobacteria bacterium]|nr:MarC family protein [Deltaproteobacteria bacterium]